MLELKLVTCVTFVDRASYVESDCSNIMHIAMAPVIGLICDRTWA